MSGCLNVLMADNAAASTAKSLVLVAASSQYLSKTWGSSPTLATKATIAFFIKQTIATSGREAMVYESGFSGGTFTSEILIDGLDAGKIQERYYDGSPHNFKSSSNINDTTTWHHICVAYDSTQATASNRAHVYIDGTEVSYDNTDAPAQNADWHLTVSGIQSVIGGNFFGSGFLDAKLAYFYFIDGQVKAPSDFTTGTGAGTTSPAAYAGTYGTNGFFLNFTGSDTTDQSGNANNWTQNGSPTFSADLPA